MVKCKSKMSRQPVRQSASERREAVQGPVGVANKHVETAIDEASGKLTMLYQVSTHIPPSLTFALRRHLMLLVRKNLLDGY